MNAKKLLLAAIGYIAVTFVVAAGWHLGLFKGVYDELGIFTRKEPLIQLGIISMILQGSVLAYVYPIGYQGGSPVKEGLRFGLLMGILMGSNAVFAEAGKQQVSSLSTWLILESVYYLFQFSLSGVLVGLIYGKGISPRRAS